MPDVTIGNLQSGADLTSGVSNLAQASINTVGDTGTVGLAFYQNPFLGAAVIAGSDGSRNALSMDIDRLMKLDLTGAPLVNNILHNGGYFVEGGVEAVTEDELRRAINDNYEKTWVRDGINTALTIGNIMQLEQKSEDYRNKGRGEDDRTREELVGEEKQPKPDQAFSNNPDITVATHSSVSPESTTRSGTDIPAQPGSPQNDYPHQFD